MRVGGYHFFTFCSPPAEQASHFLSVLPRDRDTLPPAIDVEFVGNCENHPPIHEIRANFEQFVEIVERATGRVPVLYVTADAWEAVFAEGRTALPLWLRSISRRPHPEVAPRWTFWQFAASARVPGIAAGVDLNVFRGSRAELDQL